MDVEENGQAAEYPDEGAFDEDFFLSEYDHSLDSKGRLNIPSSFRHILQRRKISTCFAMNVVDGDEICIRVYPPGFFRQSQIRSLRRQEKDLRGGIDPKARRELARKCTQLAVDKQGRINLTPKMCKRARINKEVVIVGALDYFEIWDRKLYERSHADDAARF